VGLVKIMLVRGIGVRDISTVLKISITKVLKVLKATKYRITPKRNRYDSLEKRLSFGRMEGKSRTTSG
jgi:hypothetical protein